MKWLVGTIVVVAVVWIGLRALLPRTASVATGPIEEGDSRRLGDCPKTPNCVASQTSDEARRVPAWRVGNGTDAALDAIADWIGRQPGLAVMSRSDGYLHATETTKLVGFVDDVEFLANAGGDALEVRSASRVGQSDLGENRSRIERWHEALAGRL